MYSEEKREIQIRIIYAQYILCTSLKFGGKNKNVLTQNLTFSESDGKKKSLLVPF